MSQQENSRHAAFGARIRQLRTARGFSEAQLAQRMEGPGGGPPHPGLVGAIERGEANPTLDTLVRLAVALGVEPVELFTGWASDHQV